MSKLKAALLAFVLGGIVGSLSFGIYHRIVVAQIRDLSLSLADGYALRNNALAIRSYKTRSFGRSFPQFFNCFTEGHLEEVKVALEHEVTMYKWAVDYREFVTEELLDSIDYSKNQLASDVDNKCLDSHRL